MNKAIDFLFDLFVQENRRKVVERNKEQIVHTIVISCVALFFIGMSGLAAFIAVDNKLPIVVFSFLAWVGATLAGFFYSFSGGGDPNAREMGHASPKTRPPSEITRPPLRYPADTKLVVIANSGSSMGVLPDELDRRYLHDLYLAIQDGRIDKISARSIDSAGVLPRDPNCTPNAGELVEWMKKPAYGLLVDEGNSRYTLTRVGRLTLMSIPTPLPQD